MDWLNETRDGVRLTLRVVPRSSRKGIQGVQGDALKVRLTAPPVDDKANRELLRFLAERLGVPAGAVRLTGGRASRTKRVDVTGVTVADARTRLAP